MNKYKYLKFFLFVLFILNSIFFLFFLPIWEGFDEPSHFAYIQYIAENRRLPTSKSFVSEQVGESLSKLPLNQNIAALSTTYADYWRNYKNGSKKKTEINNSKESRKNEDAKKRMTIYETQHPPLSYIISTPIYSFLANFDFYLLFFGLRFFNAFLVTIGVLIIYRTISLLIKDDFVKVASLLFMNFNFMNYYHLVRISNESLVFLLYSFVFFFIIKIIQRPNKIGDYLLLGMTYGLGLITKGFFLSTLPVLVIFLTYIFIVNKFKLKTAGYAASVFMLIALVGGWYYARNMLIYGDFTGLRVREIGFKPNAFDIKKILAFDWVKYYHFLFLNFSSVYGWNMTRPDKIFYDVYKVLFSLPYIGFLIYFIKSIFKKNLFAKIKSQIPALIISLMFIIFLLLGIGYTNFRYSYPEFEILGGWYLLGLLPFIIYLFSLGLRLLIPKNKYDFVYLYLLFVLGVYWELTVFYKYLIPTYYGL